MTHKQAVLQLLSDRKPHSHHELYALGCVAHSRISDLRRDGWKIDKWREDGLYLYQLKGRLEEAAASPEAVRDGTDASSTASSSTPPNPATGASPSRLLSSMHGVHAHRDEGVLELFTCDTDESAGLRDTYWEPDAA